MEDFIVVKKSGEREPFSFAKLKKSLYASGASESQVNRVLGELKAHIYDGMTTKVIYKKAFALLKKHDSVYACKYSLRNALFDLGPTGYPFERLISALLALKGYKTKVSVILQGACVKHEVDVLAELGDDCFAIECKFHSKAHFINNIKTPLYIHSRFLDIKNNWKANPEHKTDLKQGWIISNTKFSLDAVTYAKCVDLKLLSWNYPENGGLNKQIDSFGLFPVTALSTISKKEKDVLLETDVILISELLQKPETLDLLNLSEARKKRVLREAKRLIDTDLNVC